MDNQGGVHAYRWEAQTFKGTHQIQKGRAPYQGTEAAVRPMEDSGEVGEGPNMALSFTCKRTRTHTHTQTHTHTYTHTYTHAHTHATTHAKILNPFSVQLHHTQLRLKHTRPQKLQRVTLVCKIHYLPSQGTARIRNHRDMP